MSSEASPDSVPLPHISNADKLDLEQFRIRSRTEIARVLRDLAKNGELITAYLNDRDFMLTSVLAVDAEAGRVYLDYGNDEARNRRFLNSERLVFVGRHHQVRIQFTVKAAAGATYDNAPAFVIPLPDSLLRIQRREFYRLSTPVASRPLCQFLAEDGSNVEATIMDISLGGIAVIETAPEHEQLWEPGRVIKGCRIDLPDGRVVSDIEICNRYEVTLPGGKRQTRIGCKFLQLDARMNADIQRYIQRVELERRRRSRE